VSFDDDAAGDGAGYRPPPHPDDRIWRHPSELVGVRPVGLAPQPRHTWPWSLVAVVGTAAVLLAGAGALVLGFRGEVGDDQFVQSVSTTLGVQPRVAPNTWLGIEGYDTSTLAGSDEPEHADDDGAGTTQAPTSSTTPATDDGVDQSDTTGSTSAPTTRPSTPTAPRGVTVAQVDPEGPMADMLQPGDVLLEVDGQPITDMDELLDKLLGYQPGDQVEVTYRTIGEDGQEYVSTVLVTLAERPTDISASASTADER
jgi:S1-C subfamily serine protease